MALTASVETTHGETRELYVRLNNIQYYNSDSPSCALFRGYVNRQAYVDGKQFMWEKVVYFEATDVDLRKSAYLAIKEDVKGRDD